MPSEFFLFAPPNNIVSCQSLFIWAWAVFTKKIALVRNTKFNWWDAQDENLEYLELVVIAWTAHPT